MIKSMETAGFGRLKGGKVVFEPGLNIVQGPNEAGKSFSIEAICEGLFRDGANSSAKFRTRAYKWKSNGPFFVRLELEHEGDLYTLTRDFGEKKNSLLKPDGTEVTDKQTIAKLVESIVGLPSTQSFKATACIPQEEVAAVCDEPSLRQMLEKQVTGVGSDTNALLKRLDRAQKTILGKSGKTGELTDLRGSVAELDEQLLGKRCKVSELAKGKRELATVDKRLKAGTVELEAADAAYVGFRKYLDSCEWQKISNVEFEADREDLETFRKAKKAVAECGADLKAIAKQASELSKEIEKAEKFNVADERHKRLHKDTEALKKKLDALGKLDKKLEMLRKKKAEAVAVPRKDLKMARSLPSEISSLESALSQSVFSVQVRPESGAAFTLKADGKLFKGKQARAHAEATVDFPGAGSVDFQNLTGEKEPLTNRIEKKTKRLDALLEKYGVDSTSEIEELHTAHEALEADLERVSARKADLIGDDDLPELEASLRDLKAELAKAKRTWERHRASSLEKDALKEKKKALKDLESQRKKKEKSLNRAEGVLEAFENNEKALRKAVEEAAKRISMADAALKENAPFKCTPTDYAKLERRLEKLRRETDGLKERQLVLSDRISNDSVGQEDVAFLEERVAETNGKIQRFSREHEVLGTITKNIATARQKAIAGIS
ncbi:MAG: AAA family ATPase, partial [Planctomycetes bacterium]|nr:AAA family ATPase [Planctomycetota bacterium]